MKNEDYPLWLVGRMPTGLSDDDAAPAAPATPVQTFKQGRKHTRKTRNDERKVIMRNFIHQLDLALIDRKRELEAIHAAQAIPPPLANLILNFFSAVIQVSDRTKKHTGKAPPRTLKSAEGLTQPLQSFKGSVHGLMPPPTTSSELRDVLEELIADVAHFIQQIRITHAMVTVVDGKPLMRNRPAMQDAKVAFAELVNEYQSLRGAAVFPKSGCTLAQLKAKGHLVSAGTLRNWKKQIVDNTFGHFVQLRKQQ
jgi:hypothetical protein